VELLTEVGRRVRERRKERAMTLKALAKSAGLSERFVAGRANISVMNLAEVAAALELPIGAFFAPVQHGVIALLGLRGAGKSTVGKALAAKLGVPFFELDRLVEQEAGMSLTEIFAIHGEAYFRRLELDALRRFLNEHPKAVLATGGGLVTSGDAFRLLLERTRTVWLKAAPKDHWARVVGQGDLRPMQNRPQARAELQRRLKEREPLYAQAQQVVNTSGRTVSEIVNTLSGG
jgi:XRE family aerobic/anaerobic benzoate catabolism transcriptional regulator